MDFKGHSEKSVFNRLELAELIIGIAVSFAPLVFFLF